MKVCTAGAKCISHCVLLLFDSDLFLSYPQLLMLLFIIFENLKDKADIHLLFKMF